MLVKEDRHVEDVEILLQRLDKSVPGKGVLHVGAHQGEEVEAYFKFGFERVALIEANPRWCRFLREKFSGDSRVQVFEYAVSDRDGTVDFHLHASRSGSTESASLLEMKRLKEIVSTMRREGTITVESVTLDSFFGKHGLRFEDFGLLNLDIQGAEMMALRGGTRFLESLKAVISEVALVELYQGASLEEELTAWLNQRGFQKIHGVYHSLYDEKSTFPAWGECLFARTA